MPVQYEINVTLTSFEKLILCQMIAEESNRVEKKIRKINERRNMGEKTMYIVGEGRVDLDREYKREMATWEKIGNLWKKFECEPKLP